MLGRATFALMLLTASTNAAEIILPPAQYDHPWSGPFKPTIERLHWSDVAERCRIPHEFLGCSWHDEWSCHVVERDSLDAEDSAKLLRHEVAHCNGWPADHPGGYFQ